VYGSFSQKLRLFLLPAAILSALYLCLPYTVVIPAVWRDLMPFATYLVLAIGLFLSLHFNRNRAFFVLLMLGYFYWICNLLFQGSGNVVFARKAYDLLSLLIPINIMLFCLMREKGLLTPAGRKRFVFIGLQAAAVYFACKAGQADAMLQTGDMTGTAIAGYRTLPMLALPLMGFCGAVVAIKSYVKVSLIDSGFLGVLAGMAIIFSSVPTSDVPTVFIFAAGLIMTLSILQDSHNMAYRDDLTGLLSRRALNEQLVGLGRRYAIAMVDLDHFKRLNDTHGHDVGDQVLKMAAAKIRKVGGGGKAYRYGGEEFTIIFQRKGMEDVLPYLEELREQIGSYQFRLRGTSRPGRDREGKILRENNSQDTFVSVTTSIGVAETNGDLRTPRDVIAAADEALYRAKQRGRNRVSTALKS
jgi:GGDEF domain-containing protein